MTKARLTRLLLSLLIGIAIAVLITFYQIKKDNSQPAQGYVVAENFGGPYSLTNQDGETVTDADFKDQYRLIYFGFTYCPAICPTELQRINMVLKNLGETGDIIQPMFFTIDPERDTVEVMKQYTAMFHPRLIGITGTPEQMKDVAKKYKIYSAKVKDDTMSDYTMDHSSFIYFMGPDETLLRIFKVDDSVEKITSDVQEILKSRN